MARLAAVGQALVEFWGALRGVRRNPFFLRELWESRRWRNARDARSLRCILACCMIAPMAMGFLGAGAHRREFQAWFVMGLAAWALVLVFVAASAPSSTFHRDRLAGTGPLLACTPVRPLVEVVGRWAGASLAVGQIWLMGLGLVLFGGVFEGQARAHVGSQAFFLSFILAFIAAWIAVGAAALLLTALSVAAASIVEKPPVAAGAALGLFIPFTASMVVGPMGSEVQRHLSHRYASFDPYPGTPSEIMALAGGTAMGFSLVALFVCALLYCAALLLARRRLVEGSSIRGAHSPGKAAPPTSPSRGLVDRLMASQRTNPFYTVWRRGHLRLQTRFSVNAFPPLIVGLALLLYVQGIASRYLGYSADDHILAGVLVAGVIVASVISGCEAVLLSARTIRSEQEQSTWPLVLVSGAKPERLVIGRFCTCFHALSREWTVVLPLWIVAGLFHPPVLVLALVQPVVVALGSVVGLAAMGGGRTSTGAILVRVALLCGAFFLSPFVPVTFHALASPASGADEVAVAVGVYAAQLAAVGALWWMFRRYAVDAVTRMMVEV